MHTQKKSLLRHGLRLFILLIFLFSGPGILSDDNAPVLRVQASSVPGLKANITSKNILKLLNSYDADGSYIIQNRINAGDNILVWFSDGTTIFSGIDTAVHEETHIYSYAAEKNGKAAYFVGNQRIIYVPYTEVFPTKEMASSIPKTLRTFRYSTYVGNPDADMASNVDGIYGLMNEFMAYRTGMNTTLSLYEYLIDQNASWDIWSIYINQCENDLQACAEFKYYILHYLYYAKQNYPDIYKGIIQNKQFCKAYKKLECSYVKLVSKYEKSLIKLQTYYKKKGYTLKIKNSSITLIFPSKKSTAIYRCYNTYLKLKKELSRSRYTSLHNKLVNGAG